MAGGAANAGEFSFSDHPSLEGMKAYLQDAAPLRTQRYALRRMLVEEGGAARHTHPAHSNAEKYVYAINLCRQYVFEWNISADFDSGGALTEIYVNGEPVHDPSKAADPKSIEVAAGQKQSLAMAQKPRPQADQGESVITYLLFDRDGSFDTTADQLVMVGGPTRADPGNMGKLHVYHTKRWRSIVDAEPSPVVDYAGRCPRR